LNGRFKRLPLVLKKMAKLLISCLLHETRGAQGLVDQLLSNPYVTIGTAMKALGVTHPTANRMIGELVSKGLLRETTGRKWRKTYVAHGVLAALEQREIGKDASANSN